MRHFSRNLVNFCFLKAKYPTATIAFGSSVGKSSVLGKEVIVGKDSSISQSVLGDCVRIGSNCIVANSKLESNVLLYPHCYLNRVQMGSFSYLGNAHIAHTSIGRFCSIAPYLFCGAGIHPTNFVSTSPVFYSILNQCGVSFSNKNHFEEHKETVIGHDVWIGNRVFIKDGIKIGHGAVLGAGTVVTKDVPDYAIVAGVPAKLIRFRFPEEAIEKLLKIQWWHWTEEKLRAAQPFFAQSDIDVFIKWAFDSAEIGKEVSL